MARVCIPIRHCTFTGYSSENAIPTHVQRVPPWPDDLYVLSAVIVMEIRPYPGNATSARACMPGSSASLKIWPPSDRIAGGGKPCFIALQRYTNLVFNFYTKSLFVVNLWCGARRHTRSWKPIRTSVYIQTYTCDPVRANLYIKSVPTGLHAYVNHLAWSGGSQYIK